MGATPQQAGRIRNLRFIAVCLGIGWVGGMVFIFPLLQGHRDLPLLVDLGLNSVIGALIGTAWFAAVRWWIKRANPTPTTEN